MDGTMVDNMAYHAQSWLAFFARREQNLDEAAFFAATAGRQNHEIFRQFIAQDLSDAECAALAHEKESMYRQLYAAHRAPVPGLLNLLAEAKAAACALAVGTAAPPENVAFILDELALRPHFDAVVGSQEVARGKPEPDIFLAAAERCGVSTEGCIVFEDAPLGVEAARRAGMPCIALCTTYDAAQFADFPNVVACIRDFSEISLPQLLAHLKPGLRKPS
ncbi:MAG: HAD-IA family hydrolase [Burkholderiales bacterium]|nr:HAD-IA family hydrolase [Burkholderiales bacterium]